VPVFQSFEFIKGINYHKIVVGDISVFKAITQPLEVGARVLPKADIEFKPAKDIQEANEYSKKFANDVDITKLDVSKANVINETLDAIQARFPIGKKLNNINAKKLKNSFAQANGISIDFDIEFTNNKQFDGKDKTAKTYQRKNENYLEQINIYKVSIAQTKIDEILTEQEKKKAIEYFNKNIKKYENIIGYNRWSISTDSDTQEEALTKTTIHEYGHVTDFNYVNIEFNIKESVYFNKTIKLEQTQKELFDNEQSSLAERFKELKKQAIENGQIKQVSEYATSNNYETFAETFTMFNTGEQDNLPDGFKEFYDDLEVFVKKVNDL
jgi:hypothetical protein